MLAHGLELPVSALSWVDALVPNADSPDLLLATIRSVLDAKPAQLREEKLGDLASTQQAMGR